MNHPSWHVDITLAAQRDLRGVMAYYKLVAPEQTSRFWRTWVETRSELAINPLLAAEDDMGLRHKATRIFPYAVWYDIDEARHTVGVVGVIHTSREPGMAARRIEKSAG